MLDLVKKLMFSRQLKFERGDLEVLRQRVVITPALTFSSLLKESDDFWKTANMLYKAAKEAAQEGFSKGLIKTYKMNPGELAKWLKDINEFAGNGETEFKDLDFEKKKSVVYVKNSAFVKTFGHSDKPVDHVMRGYFAGGGSASFKTNVECVEVQCQSMGDRICKFIVMPKEELLKVCKQDKICKKQLEGV